MIRFWSRINSIMLNKYRILFHFSVSFIQLPQPISFHCSLLPPAPASSSFFQCRTGFGVVLLQPNVNPLTDASPRCGDNNIAGANGWHLQRDTSSSFQSAQLGFWGLSKHGIIPQLLLRTFECNMCPGLCSVNFHWQPTLKGKASTVFFLGSPNRICSLRNSPRRVYFVVATWN